MADHVFPEVNRLAGSNGLTLRDYFAAHALSGLLADPERSGSDELYAKAAYKYADAMISQREMDPNA